MKGGFQMSGESEKLDLTDVMTELSDEFSSLCQKRHEIGQKEYGAFTFLENDVVRMLCEELADTANYCRMQFVKLRLLQDLFEQDLSAKLTNEQKEKGEITLGIESFKGAGKGW
jgi:hypothetical protein